jgi:16S rRNA (guanine(966)-N(2))-methyltransferase RsmD
MRIITGTARGRRLRTPAGLMTRPILDRQKQMLFDVLGARVEVEGAYDLFAGSGGMGLEALSRGTGQATFVEHNRQALACLKENIAACRFEARAHVAAGDALRFDFARGRHDAGLVFVDPPFSFVAERRRELEHLLAALVATPHVLAGATVVWRIPEKAENVAVPDGLVQVDRRESGRSVILLYEKRA